MIYRELTIKNIDIDPETIYNRRLFNVFVLGLPRSGTSMMTHAIELLGVKMIHTSEEENKRNTMNARYKKKLGEEYHPNENGFFEITENLNYHYFEIMATPYSGCKMIVPVTPTDRRMDVITYNPCAKVILMWRDPEEIRQSQQAFYRGDAVEDAKVRVAWLRTCLIMQEQWLQNLNIDYMKIKYEDVLDDSYGHINNISKFINSPRNIDDAVSSIDPNKRRFVKEELIEGI